MPYLVLRDCYVGEMFRAKGSTVELPDALEKSEKNFKLIGASAEDAPEAGPNICPTCGKECASAFGLKSHMRVHQKGA